MTSSSKHESPLRWRVVVPVTLVSVALLSLYARILISDIQESEQRYIQASALFLNWLNESSQKEFRVCRTVEESDLHLAPDLRVGDILLEDKERSEHFPLTTFVREIQRSPTRTELENLFRSKDLSIYSLPTGNCDKWEEVIRLYDQRRQEALNESISGSNKL
jgi:hypothetical protein